MAHGLSVVINVAFLTITLAQLIALPPPRRSSVVFVNAPQAVFRQLQNGTQLERNLPFFYLVAKRSQFALEGTVAGTHVKQWSIVEELPGDGIIMTSHWMIESSDGRCETSSLKMACQVVSTPSTETARQGEDKFTRHCTSKGWKGAINFTVTTRGDKYLSILAWQEDPLVGYVMLYEIDMRDQLSSPPDPKKFRACRM